MCARELVDEHAVPCCRRYLFGEIMYGGHIVEDWDRWGPFLDPFRQPCTDFVHCIRIAAEAASICPHALTLPWAAATAPCRRLANAYLSKYFNEGLLEGTQLFPGFVTPPPTLNQAQASPGAGGRA